ncbi:MAG: chemotaxis protein CheW [Candidatus Sedimenticola sp. 20ELBAFRAG]
MSRVVAPSEIRGVLLPLQNGQLLLPNATVSEVVGYTKPESRKEGAPDWLLGDFSWRQQKVPLISFETLTGSARDEVGHRARIAICNTLNGNDKLPYIGILLKAIPHLVRVTRDSVAPLGEEGDAGSMVAGQVKIAGKEAWIPDLDSLEMALGDVLD